MEVQEWLEAFEDVCNFSGKEKGRELLHAIARKAGLEGVELPFSVNTPYINTIPRDQELEYPGDLKLEKKIRSYIRWNAMMMVMRANIKDSSIGGHISTFSSIATLYEVGFNHFFKGPNISNGGDMIFFQGHSSPGIYSRSFLEGRITEEHMNNFRHEAGKPKLLKDKKALSSYPHPWLMPDYWQFPTVSMGLGPMQAIYQAHVMKYLDRRELHAMEDRKVWCFMGDGESDEPESLGSLALAGREGLDNLIFVVNCNLQRLDGPVRGNGKIIQELEGVFRGAGWNVIKVLWGRRWDPLFEKDSNGLLAKNMEEVVDGEYQNFKNKGGKYTRDNFFGRYPELTKMVEDMSDEDIYRLNRGGHDIDKVYAAYDRAIKHKGQPTVILAKSVKGYGTPGEAENIAHSLKKLDMEGLKKFRDRFNIPLTDKQLEKMEYYSPAPESPEIKYMQERRKKLGGFLPQRNHQTEKLKIPKLDIFKGQLESSGDREYSSTMSFVRMLSSLCRDKEIGKRIVPIVPDEARTFGMEGLFRQLGIYSSAGQKYVPHDADQIMSYREDVKGQILEEGINEAGSISTWIAAATSAYNNSLSLMPFYIFYSMFGFQRVGDFIWAAGDMQAQGFLIGATSGRTTLAGEGLQHLDGHSHIMAGTVPNCISYDPTFSYELAVIIHSGMERMYTKNERVFYYITTMNENYQH
ncbi:MAG: pyruvate dehydrogenase (acetyl-transferring), homodimeric type, partial [Candidatus Portiera sp.]|nr:pyruvate dehydrogenase (acetyl-transferring), homodimeric type [Portiera sp.]